MEFASSAQRKAVFANLGFKQKLLGVGLIGALGAKLYLYHKYRQWKASHALENQPGWRNRRSFASMPRAKQRQIIYGKRANVRDLENITYGSGYSPRSLSLTRNRWRFGTMRVRNPFRRRSY